METFYSTILLAVLALFGLLLAALIYVAQTVNDRYSTRIAQRLLRGRLSIVFWACGLIALTFSSVGLVNVAFPCASRLSRVGFLFSITERLSYGLITVVALCAVFIFFAITLRRYSRLISPLGVLDEINADLTPAIIRDIALFRLHRVESTATIDPSELSEFLQGFPPSDGLAKWLGDKPQVAKEERRKVANSMDNRIKKIKHSLSRKAARRGLEDPLSDVFEYSLLALSKNNEHAWRAALEKIFAVFDHAIEKGFLAEKAGLPFLADELLSQWLERALNEIDIASRHSFVIDLSKMVRELCQSIGKAHLWSRAYRWLVFFQTVGERAILRKDAVAFQETVNALVEIGIYSLDNEPNSRVFDDVCRRVGWLGEKLILQGIDNAPIMPSGKESEELSTIKQAIYQMTAAVCRTKSDKYPLILRDAIEVICDQALERREPKKFAGMLVEMLNDHRDLAQHLIHRRCAHAAAYLFLILQYFEQTLRKYNLSDYGELNRDIFYWVTTLAQEAIVHNLPAEAFGRGETRDLQGMIIDFMTRIGKPDDWEGHMSEIVIKSHGHMDEAWTFVKRAGMRLHSNFGLMFDWNTGEDYAKDDPRRR